MFTGIEGRPLQGWKVQQQQTFLNLLKKDKNKIQEKN